MGRTLAIATMLPVLLEDNNLVGMIFSIYVNRTLQHFQTVLSETGDYPTVRFILLYNIALAASR